MLQKQMIGSVRDVARSSQELASRRICFVAWFFFYQLRWRNWEEENTCGA